ncbi:MAG: APC family permease [Acidobacteriota bacterium]
MSEDKEILKARQKKIPDKKRISGLEILESEPSETAGRAEHGLKHTAPRKLSQFFATAICGNDITSSCLYVAAICTAYAGRLAPLCLLLVACLLYLYRKIYGEVVGALPLNGGAYNALLNSTSKFQASMAACMTILSYMATAVISAKTAVEYSSTLINIPILPVTVGILAVFALLTILGITESARVAAVIFVLHLATLTVLVLAAFVYTFGHLEIITANWQMPLPGGRGIFVALFFGFASGLLGISGFESSANFVEEQESGVFPKTLRNMWIAVSIFNPLIALLALGLLPIPEISSEVNREFLLASMGHAAAGRWLQILIAVDAPLVLCGAVLTSFVGVGGLVRRMTLDRCLPQFLLKANRRGTTHRIFILFFLLCTSIMLLTGGDLFALAGVYTLSFLGVMSLFVIGNMLLKVRRARLPRPERAGWLVVLVALSATLAGIIGNALIDPRYIGFFLTYFVPTVLVVAIMFLRIHLLKLVLVMVRGFADRVRRLSRLISSTVVTKMEEINSLGIIFFADGNEDLATLNRAMLYVRQNELTKRVRVIHVYRNRKDVPEHLKRNLELLDEVYPEIRIELVLMQGTFDPETIQEISQRYRVPQNYMFIGHPSKSFPYRLEELGGVRLIV